MYAIISGPVLSTFEIISTIYKLNSQKKKHFIHPQNMPTDQNKIVFDNICICVFDHQTNFKTNNHCIKYNKLTNKTKILKKKNLKTSSDTSVVSPKIPKLTTNISLGAVRRQSTATTFVDAAKYQQLFSKTTKAIVWGMQTRAVQSMLDFDFICR